MSGCPIHGSAWCSCPPHPDWDKVCKRGRELGELVIDSLETKPFQNNLRRIREALGITQQELTDRLGRNTPGSVSHWESGRRLPGLATLYRLRGALGCSWDALLCEPKEEA